MKLGQRERGERDERESFYVILIIIYMYTYTSTRRARARRVGEVSKIVSRTSSKRIKKRESPKERSMWSGGSQLRLWPHR